MRVERVTVTTTPTSIKSLMEAIRPNKADVPAKCTVITFKYNTAEAAVVQISDVDTTNKVTILDNVTENLRAATFEDFDISLILLSTVSGTVGVDIVISQGVL